MWREEEGNNWDGFVVLSIFVDELNPLLSFDRPLSVKACQERWRFEIKENLNDLEEIIEHDCQSLRKLKFTERDWWCKKREFTFSLLGHKNQPRKFRSHGVVLVSYSPSGSVKKTWTIVGTISTENLGVSERALVNWRRKETGML